MSTSQNARPVNWLEDTSRSLAASFPLLGAEHSVYISQRLSRLLLDRLPPEIGRTLVMLLPQDGSQDGPGGETREAAELREHYLIPDRQPDVSIGYSALVEQASRSFRATLAPIEQAFVEKVVDYFLWAFAQELPPDLKESITAHLPVDIRTRMNLQSSHADEAKVA